jgi:DNA-binding NtrC family response regulator
MNDQPNIRVLLVDDEEDLLEFLSKQLLKEGYTVRAASSGEGAIKVADQEHYDVAVVDLKMPGMDGVETQRKLHEIQPLLQCIVLTAHGSIDSALESGHEDAFEYLLKPVDYKELVATIKDAYAKKTALQEAKFREEVEALYRTGLGPHGIRNAVKNLQRIYGIE